MNEVDYDKLKKSLDRLVEQYEFFNLNEHTLSGNIKEGIKESVIKRFEICYDTLCKCFKKFTQEKAGLSMPNSPTPLFRKAHESILIDRGMLERLLDYNDLRNAATHDYSEVKVGKSFNKIGDFIQDAAELYKQMSEDQ